MSTPGPAALSPAQRLLAMAERRLPALTRLRAPENLPVRLHRRRIYVLPTFFGLGFAVLLLVMQLGALNYGNNPALLLTCILGAAAWMSLFAGFRALAGLELTSVSAGECHADAPLELELVFAPSPRPRASLHLELGGGKFAFAIASGDARRLQVSLPAQRRGWLRPGRMKLWTEQPLGLFVVWSWIHPELSILVYPRAEENPPPLPRGPGQPGERLAAGDGDEYSGLREYRSGDPQRRIAWKASARHDGLLVRESEDQVDDCRLLSYAAIGGLDHEARISRLTAWVMAAEASMLSYCLDVPGQQVGPGLGKHHRHRCLQALALLPDAP
ncbi:MAG TPA: DUF58 domain-containing protein [Dokdonella sp.]|nr:DUF58 domain-containing protein [Dokdonella sp.]